MELFFSYDFNRLKAYKSVEELNNRIKILEEYKFMAFSFPEVGYFNYAFPTNGIPMEKFDVDYINDFYFSFGLDKYKIIVPPHHGELKELLASKKSFKKSETIVQTNYPLKKEIDFNINSDIIFIPVDKGSILEFTELYLASFEAVGRDVYRVARNFECLMEESGVEFFIANNGSVNVGINVLYKEENNYLLAGGAILPEFRNHNYHKSGLTMRLQKCLEDPLVERINSWAYKGGVSLHNMNSLNMIEEKEFEVFEYTGREK